VRLFTFGQSRHPPVHTYIPIWKPLGERFRNVVSQSVSRGDGRLFMAATHPLGQDEPQNKVRPFRSQTHSQIPTRNVCLTHFFGGIKRGLWAQRDVIFLWLRLSLSPRNSSEWIDLQEVTPPSLSTAPHSRTQKSRVARAKAKSFYFPWSLFV